MTTSFQVAQWERICLPMQEMQETQVWSLAREDALEEEMATHSSTLAWRIPWTEEPGGLQCVGVAQSWTRLSTHTAHGGLMEKRRTSGGRRHNPSSPSSSKPEPDRPGKASLEGPQNPVTAEGLCTPCPSPSASSIVLSGERDWQAKSRGWETWPHRGALSPSRLGLGALLGGRPPGGQHARPTRYFRPSPCLAALLPAQPGGPARASPAFAFQPGLGGCGCALQVPAHLTPGPPDGLQDPNW